MVKNLNTGAYSVKKWVINETQPFDYNTLKKCRAGHFQFCGCLWHLQNIVALQPCLLQSKTSARLTDSLIKNKWKRTVGWFPLVLHGRTTEQPNNVPFCSSNFIVVLHHRALGWFCLHCTWVSFRFCGS